MTPLDPWSFLQTHTAARIAQGRAGHGLPTRALLDFQLDHARACDAVQAQLDTVELMDQLAAIRPAPLLLHSQATERQMYLKRPDLGRKLDVASRLSLHGLRTPDQAGVDLAIVIADGLSAVAIHQHAVEMVSSLVQKTQELSWSLAPISVVEQGRVAIGDEVAHALGAEMVVVFIGERPGLTSPHSLGAYLTYKPRPGLTDEARNCVSNIRPDEGLPYAFAVEKLMYLLTEMKRRRLSGVGLKDDSSIHTPLHTSSPATNGRNPEIPD